MSSGACASFTPSKHEAPGGASLNRRQATGWVWRGNLILPGPSDGIAKGVPFVSAQTPLFEVETAHCGTVCLNADGWEHITYYHPEVAPYMQQVEQTLVRPHLVYETTYKKPTRAYYARGLIEDYPYRGCYVAVFVRYKLERPCVCTAYLPAHLSANPGTLLHAER